MASIQDLEQYAGFETCTTVGWLGRDSNFERAPVTEEFFLKLRELTAHPWQPVVSFGIHFCELCQFDAPGFSDNVFVPYRGKIYVAPVGIVHYISVHWYRPPQVFIDAVLACPAMDSMDYKRALLANGGRGLVTKVPT